MGPHEENGVMALTIDMLLAEPAYPGLMDVEEMLMEQRGAREVIQLFYHKFKPTCFHF